KRGIPTVTIVTEEFRNLYGVVTKSLGQPALEAVWIQHPIVSVPHPEMRQRANPVIPAIVAVATGTNGHAPAGGDRAARAGAAAEGVVEVVERLTLPDSLEAVYERFAAEGWTDGLPIVPPTEERVARMLAYSDLDPSCSLGPMPPRWGQATVAK